MRLRSLADKLLEAEGLTDMYTVPWAGWMDRSGRFHRLTKVNERTPNHVSWAKKHIVSPRELAATNGPSAGSRVYAAAFNKGWVRMTGWSFVEVNGFELTPQQAKELKNMGAEHHKSVEWTKYNDDMIPVSRIPRSIFEPLLSESRLVRKYILDNTPKLYTLSQLKAEDHYDGVLRLLNRKGVA